jgi:isopenicillin-N N-acyltransferase like protein
MDTVRGMSTELPVPLVAVSGTPAECGAGYGSAAAERIAKNLAVYRRRFADQAGLDEAAVRRAGAAFRAVTLELHPRIAAMLDGVGEGAGVAVEEVYALNARTELLYGASVPRARPPAPDADGACTAVGVLGPHTANGHLLLGQNWDWHPDQRDAMVLLATRDERGLAVLALAEAGMLAKAGLNSAGLGVCVNMLGCDRDGLDPAGIPADEARRNRPQPALTGVPYHVLLRAVLEADSLSWAIRTACRTPRNASINLLIGQAGESTVGGELIDLEVVPGDVGWLNPVDGLLTHANHLETALPVRDTIKDFGGSSPFRSARARRLLAEPAAGRKVTEADLADVFRDHASFPSAICRHVDQRDAPLERSETVYSLILDLDERTMGLAAGPPCQHEYAWLSLLETIPVGAESGNNFVTPGR